MSFHSSTAAVNRANASLGTVGAVAVAQPEGKTVAVAVATELDCIGRGWHEGVISNWGCSPPRPKNILCQLRDIGDQL
jgi:hypothetical protein